MDYYGVRRTAPRWPRGHLGLCRFDRPAAARAACLPCPEPIHHRASPTNVKSSSPTGTPTPPATARSTSNGGSQNRGKPHGKPPLSSDSSFFPTFFESNLCRSAKLPFLPAAEEPKLHLSFQTRRCLPL